MRTRLVAPLAAFALVAGTQAGTAGAEPPGGVRAAGTATVVDPAGDAGGAQADIVEASASYDGSTVTFDVTVPGGADATTDPSWRDLNESRTTGLEWQIDLDDDGRWDILAMFNGSKDGSLDGGFFRFDGVQTCEATATQDGAGTDESPRVYRVTGSPSCVAWSPVLSFQARLVYDPTPDVPDDEPQQDLAPDGGQGPNLAREGAVVPSTSGQGYHLVGADGGVFTHGDARFFGSLGGTPLNAPVFGLAPTPTGDGYWMAAHDGGVFTFGDARFLGSLGGTRLNAAVVGMEATPSGDGYWMVAHDGGVFTFGDAPFLGSLGGVRLQGQIVDIEPTPTGQGYWLLGLDGGVFAFGDAGFHGSAAGQKRGASAMAASPTGNGYLITSHAGEVSRFGDAPMFGGLPEIGVTDAAPVFSIDTDRSGAGYWLSTIDGGVYTFGPVAFHGSTAGARLEGLIFGLERTP